MALESHQWVDRIVWAAALAYLCVFAACQAEAATSASDERMWREECGTCHLAYPARLLPASGWRALMGSLAQHFGVDASLDAAAAGTIGRYLETHAGPASAGAGTGDARRITARSWFTAEHRELAASTWSRPTVRSASNCTACHLEAERGRFDEDAVRVPQ